MKSMSIRTATALGLAGALLMFIGDMCLYGHWGSGADFSTNLSSVIAEESDPQIMIGGFIGPVAALLYCAGFFAVYRMISPKSPSLALIVAGCFIAAIVFGGTYHATWGIRALLMKGGVPSGPRADLYEQARHYMNLFFNTMAALGGVAALLLVYVVLWRRSLYPRWTVIVNPALLYLLAPLARLIPSPLGAIVVGGYYNLMFMAFFLVTMVCARSRTDPHEVQAP